MAGAFIFREIEKDAVKDVTINVTNARNATAFNILYITLMDNTFNELLWKKRVGNEFLAYAEVVTQAVRNGYDGSDDPEDKSWSFPIGFLYSLTVITTIGKSNFLIYNCSTRMVYNRTKVVFSQRKFLMKYNNSTMFKARLQTY